MAYIKKTKVVKIGKVKKSKATIFDVFTKSGAFIRQYSKELHGDKAEEWAKNFCEGTTNTYKAVE